jgi:thioesterase-3
MRGCRTAGGRAARQQQQGRELTPRTLPDASSARSLGATASCSGTKERSIIVPTAPTWPGRAQTSKRKKDNRMKTAIQIEVRPTELDNMGHVNNAKFLEYMEWSREDWYNKAELSFDTFTALGLGTVTVNININYRKEARLGQHLTISTEPVRKGRTSFVLKHVVINANEELVADAEVVSVTIDLQSRKASPLPDALAKMFG